MLEEKSQKFLEIAAEVYNRADASKRAKLRDKLANILVTDQVMKQHLIEGNVQLDTTEFLNFLLDDIIPDEKRITEVVTNFYEENGVECSSSKEEKNTKIELPFVEGQSKVSEFLHEYQEEESISDSEKIRTDGGEWTRKKTELKASGNSEIVISLKRFKARFDKNQKVFVSEKIEENVTLDSVEIGNQKYEPTAFIVHHGGIGSGHYIAYIKEKKENDESQWVCYNDKTSTQIETKNELPDQAKNAYVVKYSPIIDQVQVGAGRYKTGLPSSQGCGTDNNGNQCWANAAFAFALSMAPALYGEKISSTVITSEEASPKSSLGTGNGLFQALLQLEEQEGLEEIADYLDKANLFIEGGQKEPAEKALKDIGYAGVGIIIRNAVGRFLVSIVNKNPINDKILNEIFELQESLSSLDNLSAVVEIFKSLADSKSGSESEKEFLLDPRGFCKKQAPTFKKVQCKSHLDLAYEAFLVANKDDFTSHFKLARTEYQDPLVAIMTRLVLEKDADPENKKDNFFAKLREYTNETELHFNKSLSKKIGGTSVKDLFEEKQSQLAIKKERKEEKYYAFKKLVPNNFFFTAVANDEKLQGKTLIKIVPKDKEEFKNNQFWVTTTNSSFQTTSTFSGNHSEVFSRLIEDVIKDSRDETTLDDKEVAMVILLAIKYQGIANANNQQGLRDDISKLIVTDTNNEFLEKAKKFSAAFQTKMQEQQIYTGNQNAKDLVGMRLKRLNPKFALDLLKNVDDKTANQEYSRIQGVLEIDVNKIISEQTPSHPHAVKASALNPSERSRN